MLPLLLSAAGSPWAESPNVLAEPPAPPPRPAVPDPPPPPRHPPRSRQRGVWQRLPAAGGPAAVSIAASDSSDGCRLRLHRYIRHSAAGLPLAEVHEKYEFLLSTLKDRAAKSRSERHRILLVYMTGIGERHIAKEILERNDFQLYTQKMVPNSGVINHLSGTANTLEVSQLSY